MNDPAQALRELCTLVCEKHTNPRPGKSSETYRYPREDLIVQFFAGFH